MELFFISYTNNFGTFLGQTKLYLLHNVVLCKIYILDVALQ